MHLEQFEELAKSRRAVRNFKSDPVDHALLLRLLDITRWAPSGYNLQPTHFFVVTDPSLKEKLHTAALRQRQVLEAPAVVVFAGDRDVARNHFEQVLQADKSAGAINEEYEAKLRRYVPLAFGAGPLGITRCAKALAVPVFRRFKPTPDVPVANMCYWLAKQVMLCAMTFMLAARSAGLDTVPMEGFDESRVKRALGIPRSFIVPVMVPIGYATAQKRIKTRLPLGPLVHMNGFASS